VNTDKAMKKIGPETAGPGFLAQVAIGCGDDAGLGNTCLRFADALILAVFQDAE
jgi:hypothetical protein